MSPSLLSVLIAVAAGVITALVIFGIVAIIQCIAGADGCRL